MRTGQDALELLKQSSGYKNGEILRCRRDPAAGVETTGKSSDDVPEQETPSAVAPAAVDESIEFLDDLYLVFRNSYRVNAWGCMTADLVRHSYVQPAIS